LAEAIELRRARATDAAAIRRLTREAYAKWVPIIGREPKPMGADYEAAIREHRFDLLYVDGVLAALLETVDEGGQLLIENVAVSPRFQRRGLGSKLMAHAEQIAVALGHDRIRLYTNKRFAGNVELYRKLGFNVDGEEDIGGGTVRVDMSKTLGETGRR
jgi:ribosomal protein S18 acetylase RimI-like enzyme